MLAYADELIRFCQQLIRVKSLSGGEEAAAALIRDKMLELGFDAVRTDRLGNVIGKVAGRSGGPALLLDSHMDTAPADGCGPWSCDPFGGELEQGRIYGRGATDMKGALAAMIFGVAQLKQAGVEPAGDVYVSASVWGQQLEGVALREVMDAVRPAAVILGAATGLNLHIGQSGRAEIKASRTSRGLSGNAVMDMLPFLNGLKQLAERESGEAGGEAGTVTDIISSPYPGLPGGADGCMLTIDRRLLQGEQEPDVLAAYRKLEPGIHLEIAEKTCIAYTGQHIRARRFCPAWLMEVDHPLVELALKALHDKGIPSRIAAFGRCGGGSYSAGEAGVPTIGFGPSYETLAHKPDEYIELDQLIRSSLGYYAIARTWALSLEEEMTPAGKSGKC